MQIKRLVIENFKSIERIELIEPNPFTVFVGPNGSGKSNIFEALEFVILSGSVPAQLVSSLFGGVEKFGRWKPMGDEPTIAVELKSSFKLSFRYTLGTTSSRNYRSDNPEIDDSEAQQLTNFTRLFVGNERLVKLKFTDDRRLSLSAKNMETVLKRILTDQTLSEEVHEWLSLFIPGFRAIEVVDGPFSNEDTLLVYEQGVAEPFTRELISDGTYSIIALLTAVYQSDDKPQFLCIEEPENGLHPQVARELVDFFRLMCEERGHYIWLNTHSPYMVSRVRPEELVVVDKVNGATQVKQFKAEDFDGMRMDDAWLTNVLNGGKAW